MYYTILRRRVLGGHVTFKVVFNPSFFSIVLGVQQAVSVMWARRPRKAREQTKWKGWRTP